MPDPKIAKKSPSGHHRTNLSGYIFAGTYQQSEKKLVKQQRLPHMSLQYGELGPLAAEICWRVWGTPANFNGFRVSAALLHGTVVVGVSQTLRHRTEGATYIRQGGHHVGQWPHFSCQNNFGLFQHSGYTEHFQTICVWIFIAEMTTQGH